VQFPQLLVDLSVLNPQVWEPALQIPLPSRPVWVWQARVWAAVQAQ
jgi:hypothetical protein